MKKWLSLLLCLTMLCTSVPGCGEDAAENLSPQFSGPNDPAYIQYLEDMAYAGMEESFSGEEYSVESVRAVYISQEYLDELEFNSRQNIFFGFTLEEVLETFGEDRYVFTLGENHETTVIHVHDADFERDYSQILRNVAIGGGVILLCITVSVLTSGAGTPVCVQVIHAIAAGAATEAMRESVKGAVYGGLGAAICQWNETGSIDDSIYAGLSAASEGFKMGAIIGAVEGGIKGGIEYMIYSRLPSRPIDTNKIDIEQADSNDYNIKLSNESNKNTIPTPYESQDDAQRLFDTMGNSESQVAFLNGEVVHGKPDGCGIPDFILKDENGFIKEAYEVKNYDLVHNKASMLSVLRDELSNRAVNLPEGVQQHVVLDVRGRGYEVEFVEGIKQEIIDAFSNICPGMKVFAMW